MIYAGLTLFGFAVGVLSGLFGIGGGIVLVPGLVLLLGLGQAEAQGTSLAVLARPVPGFAAYAYYQNGYVRPATAGLAAVGFDLGAYGGARLVPQMPVSALRVGLGMLLLNVGTICLTQDRDRASQAALSAGLALPATVVLRFLLRIRSSGSDSAPQASNCDYHI